MTESNPLKLTYLETIYQVMELGKGNLNKNLPTSKLFRKIMVRVTKPQPPFFGHY